MVGSSLEGHPARAAAYSRLAHAMFAHEGLAWTVKSHATRASDLAGRACFANAAGFVLLGTFTGSVVRTTRLTGVVTDLGVELVRGRRWIASRVRSFAVPAAAALAASLDAFVAGPWRKAT